MPSSIQVAVNEGGGLMPPHAVENGESGDGGLASHGEFSPK